MKPKWYLDKKRFGYLDDLMREYIAKSRLHDAACAVITEEGTQWTKFWGDVTPNSIYRIFSMTKPLTAACVYLLLERGKIELFQPVSEFFPEFKEQQVWNGKGLQPAKREIRLFDLLHMVSGMAYPGDGTYPGEIMKAKITALSRRYKCGEKLQTHDIIRAFAETPLIFQPGEQWHYGISADILGMIIEKTTGMDLAVFMRRELFEPLEMRHSGFWISEKDKQNLADIYYEDKGSLSRITEKQMDSLFLRDPCKRPPFLAGGSGLYSTLEEYSHFVQMLLNKGKYKGRRILSLNSIAAMGQPALDREQKKTIYFDGMEGYNYGNLMRHMENAAASGGVGAIGEYGWDGLLGNEFFVCPQYGFGYVYFQQMLNGADYVLRRKQHQILYSSAEREET